MIKKSTLAEVVEQQHLLQLNTDIGYRRDLLSEINTSQNDFALIISGIRRCGKSTLLKQLMEKTKKKYFFLNFDTARLYTFTSDDFALLDELITEKDYKILFFDEIQVVDGWELFVRQKLDEGYRVVLTGSNATLLSKELGTKLTGRHITKELFPFSYGEFCAFKMLKTGAASFSDYLNSGGFPAFLKEQNIDLHSALLDDIIYRDVAVRHNIKDVHSLKHLVLFLASNVGNLISATKLKQLIGIKSTATILEYLSFFEQSYLIQLVPKFSYSYKVQVANPRKVYFIDSGLQNAVTGSFNNDNGRKLENVVFWELRRLQKELFYYNENGKECDFVVCRNKAVEQVMQVCYELNTDNERREIDGLIDAMDFFKTAEGIILTFAQEDVISHGNKRIKVIPAFRYFGS